MVFYIVVSVLLLLFHLLLGSFLDLGSNIVVAIANIFFVSAGRIYWKRYSRDRFTLYLVGYFLLFLFFFGIADSPLIFSIYLLFYSTLFRLPRLLGYFLIFAFSFFLIPVHAMELFLGFSVVYSITIFVFPTIRSLFLKICFGLGIIFLVVIFLPVFHFMFLSTPQSLWVALKVSDFQSALLNSFATATLSTLIIASFGVPLSYWLSRTSFSGKRILYTLIDIPIIIPHTTVGILILALLGPRTFLGELLENKLNIEVGGTYWGIMLCQIFVSFPFLIKSCTDAFSSAAMERLENVSRSLGSNDFFTFLYVSLPIAFKSILSGASLTWARAISESGSLLVIAYYPLTMGNYAYDVFTQFGISEVRPFVVILIVLCIWSFIILQYFSRDEKRWLI